MIDNILLMLNNLRIENSNSRLIGNHRTLAWAVSGDVAASGFDFTGVFIIALCPARAAASSGMGSSSRHPVMLKQAQYLVRPCWAPG
jgi:hypothetical protein